MDNSEEPIDNYDKRQRELISKISAASQIIASSSRGGMGNHMLASKYVYEMIFGQGINIKRLEKMNKMKNG
jgi:hypothetical protein